MTIEMEDLTVAPWSGEESDGPTFVLRQRIAKAGHQAGSVVFRTRTSEGKEAIIPVSVSYQGIHTLGD